MDNQPLELPEAFALAAAAWRRGLVSAGAIRDAQGRPRVLDQLIDPGAETERAHFESYYGELRAFWRIAADEARRRPAAQPSQPPRQPQDHRVIRELRKDLGHARRAATILRQERDAARRAMYESERIQVLGAIRAELMACELRLGSESGAARERLKGAALALRWLLDRQLLPQPSRADLTLTETTP